MSRAPNIIKMSSQAEQLLEVLDFIKSKGLRGVGNFLVCLLTCEEPKVKERVTIYITICFLIQPLLAEALAITCRLIEY